MSIISFAQSCKIESLETFNKHSGNNHIELLATEINSDSINNVWNAFIFLGGSKFRLMFKVSFTTIVTLGLAAERFTEVDEADYVDQVKDFMREYCNLLAGKLKACFEKVTDAYLSLPIITREYDIQSIFGELEKEILSEHWSIGDNKMKIDLSLYYFEKTSFENYNFIIDNLSSSIVNEEIEFF